MNGARYRVTLNLLQSAHAGNGLDKTRTDALVSQPETGKRGCVHRPRCGRLSPGACKGQRAGRAVVHAHVFVWNFAVTAGSYPRIYGTGAKCRQHSRGSPWITASSAAPLSPSPPPACWRSAGSRRRRAPPRKPSSFRRRLPTSRRPTA